MLSDRDSVQLSRGVPPLDAIPRKELARLTMEVVERHKDSIFQYAPLGGYLGDPTLRDGLADWHAVDSSRIFISNGSLQVLDLVTGHLLRTTENCAVYVETPTYDRAVQVFERHGGSVTGIGVEQDGMDVDALERLVRAHPPAFVYTIPDFQNPTGVTMSESKRRALIRISRTYGFTIVEDIPYRELRYHGITQTSLGSIDGAARVITVGSLTKVLSPGLRIGYAVSDAKTSSALAVLAENTYLSPPPLCQAIAAQCLAAGVVRSSIANIRDILRHRHDSAVATVRGWMSDSLIAVPNGGYFLGVHLRCRVSEDMFLRAAREVGVVLTPGSAFYAPDSAPPPGTLFVRLPFQSLEPDEFAVGIERLVGLADAH